LRCDTLGIVRLSRGKQSRLPRPWTQSRRVVLLALVWINVIAFVAQLSLEASQPGFVRDYLALSDYGVLNAYSWQFITALVLYGNPWHFVGNVIVLYVLGRDIESILGQRHCLYLFLSGAIAGELGHLFLMPSETVLYAASGGVAAVIIAYATILPEMDLFAWRTRFFFLHVNATHFVYTITFLSLVMLMVDRNGAVIHSAIPGGLIAGWLYANLLGYGHPSWLQRKLAERRAAAQRLERMSGAEFLELEINPLLEKISRSGIDSLTRAERQILACAREKIG
jgi:membrane associated rhomboid family serine protease